jgi:hypothetical protein
VPGGHFSTVKSPAGAAEMRSRFLSRALRRIPRSGCAEDKGATRSTSMMDILMLALGFGFFALAIGYTYACERL